MSESCVFCSIAARRADAAIVLEGADVVAFMDARPIRPGHVLVVPRAHNPELLDIDGDTYAHVLDAARTIGRAIRQAFQPKKVGIVVAGFDVPHAHVHVIPMHDYHDVTSRALLEGTLEVAAMDDLRDTAEKLKRELDGA
ncbi:MAG: diadenosine tetraphosphate (Ap4A) hydrolase [Polyangiaceae bacterium]